VQLLHIPPLLKTSLQAAHPPRRRTPHRLCYWAHLPLPRVQSAGGKKSTELQAAQEQPASPGPVLTSSNAAQSQGVAHNQVRLVS